MQLKDWLKTNKFDPDNVMFLSVGTDGLSTKKNNLMSLSLMTQKIKGTIYVHGATPAPVQEYTGVTTEYYKKHSQPFIELVSQMKEALDGPLFIVTYNTKFQKRWLEKCGLLDQIKIPMFDLVNWFKVRQAGDRLSVQYPTIGALITALDSASVGLKLSFNALISLYTQELNKDKPELEMKTTYLKHLWNIALTL